jgi:hypothetical protein
MMELTTKQNAKGIATPRTRSFSFPHEVIDDPSFSPSEKRAILCEWASDACAVESFPTLRLLPGTTFPVTFSAVMDALAQLDRVTARHTSEEDDLTRRVVIADFVRRKNARHMEG